MTAIAFADEMTIPDVTPDVIPEVSDVEYPCVVCGREAGPYGGRGRKPTRCPEHKKTPGGSARTTPRVTGTNATLAAQATEALCSIDGILQLGTTVMGFTETASVIADADEVFRMRVHAALINSPDTCRKILRYGSKAGDSALVIAILLHVATIAPVFVQEAKAKKAERVAIQAAKEAESANAA
jgi:hypothetical protein